MQRRQSPTIEHCVQFSHCHSASNQRENGDHSGRVPILTTIVEMEHALASSTLLSYRPEAASAVVSVGVSEKNSVGGESPWVANARWVAPTQAWPMTGARPRSAAGRTLCAKAAIRCRTGVAAA